MRFLPPATPSKGPYVSTSQVDASPTSAKARLNATRWPSLSVSTRTPSQSKIRARIGQGVLSDFRQELAAAIRAAELGDLGFEEILERCVLRGEHAQRLRIVLRLAVVLDEAVHEHVVHG